VSSWSWYVSFSAPKDVVFKETVYAINALGIATERVDEYNGMIEAKKKDMWGGDQHAKISIAPYAGGCSFYIEVSQRQISASGRCGMTGTGIMQVMAARLAPFGYDKMVELAPASFDRPIIVPSAGQTTAPPVQAQPPPPPPPPQAAQNCPTCGGSLTFIQQYNRWYCYNCKKYP